MENLLLLYFQKEKQSEDYSIEDFSKFLKTYKPNNIKVNKIESELDKDTIDVELSISDYHLAKRYVEGNNNVTDRALAFF